MPSPFDFEVQGKADDATAPLAGAGAPTASGPPLGVGKSGGGGCLEILVNCMILLYCRK